MFPQTLQNRCYFSIDRAIIDEDAESDVRIKGYELWRQLKTSICKAYERQAIEMGFCEIFCVCVLLLFIVRPRLIILIRSESMNGK